MCGVRGEFFCTPLFEGQSPGISSPPPFPRPPSLSPLPPAEVLVLARYRAQTEDELSLAPGDVIRQVCPGPARGWLLGELRGRRGLFPKRLVQVRPVAGKAAGKQERP